VKSVKSRLRGFYWLWLSVVLIYTDLLTRADTITVNPIADSTIAEGDPGTPQGTLGILVAGTTGPNEGATRNRALLKFDLASGIPRNANVTSAALTVTVVSASPLVTNLWFSLHKVAANWGEAAVTWTNRLSPPAPWVTPGGDFAISVTQSNLITGVGTFTFTSNPDMVADVQDWVRAPASNFGWILLCELEALEKSVRKFGSRDYSTNNARPSLEVQFNPEPPPLTLTLLSMTNGVFQFQFNAESNRSYTVEYVGDLSANNWSVLTNISPLPAPANVLVSDSVFSDSNRFYRVRTP
jgi:hypothetical protein